VIAKASWNIQETLPIEDPIEVMKTREAPRAAAIVLVVSVSVACALGGCGATSSADGTGRTPAVARQLNRADAIASARQDALRNYGSGWGTQADARYQSGFWVVELQAATGYRLRYAISAQDGSIRERSMVQ
jgi:hypothetical protein